MNLADLKKPFPQESIEWRIQQSGISNGRPWAIVLPYVTARDVQDRLDHVVGPENWQDSYHHLESGVVCRLSIRINGEWVTKENGSPETQIDAFKGGISKALVRVASSWGIGRYLYDAPISFAKFVDKGTPGAFSATVKDEHGKKHYLNWLPPELPKHLRTPTQDELIADLRMILSSLTDQFQDQASIDDICAELEINSLSEIRDKSCLWIEDAIERFRHA